MNIRKNDGFTLVELMVTILVAAVVITAASSVLLMGLRVHNQSVRTQKMQNNIRILTTALEDMAAEGAIKEVITDYITWQVKGESDNVLCHYQNGTIYIGEGTDTPVLSDIFVSNALLTDKNLLTVMLETEEGVFSTSIFCRTGIGSNGEAAEATQVIDKYQDALADFEGTKLARTEFLNTLASQYMTRWNSYNIGQILINGDWSQEYYSQWYFNTNPECYLYLKWGEDWDKDTPWCACFVSWALARVKDYVEEPADRVNGDSPFWFAHVNEFRDYFEKEDNEAAYLASADPAGPKPGNIIFFDTTKASNDYPNHVGVVLYAELGETDYVYTLEGNSLGVVAVRRYLLEDESILGYGILPWVTDAELNGENTGE